MSYKARLIASVIVIILISWFDFQFLSLHTDTFAITDDARRVIHLLLLVIVMLAGAFTWAKCQQAWIGIIWRYAYLLAIALLFLTGMISHFAHINNNVHFALNKFRLFFTSPLPLGILYIFSRLPADN